MKRQYIGERKLGPGPSARLGKHQLWAVKQNQPFKIPAKLKLTSFCLFSQNLDLQETEMG